VSVATGGAQNNALNWVWPPRVSGRKTGIPIFSAAGTCLRAHLRAVETGLGSNCAHGRTSCSARTSGSVHRSCLGQTGGCFRPLVFRTFVLIPMRVGFAMPGGLVRVCPAPMCPSFPCRRASSKQRMPGSSGIDRSTPYQLLRPRVITVDLRGRAQDLQRVADGPFRALRYADRAETSRVSPYFTRAGKTVNGAYA